MAYATGSPTSNSSKSHRVHPPLRFPIVFGHARAYKGRNTWKDLAADTEDPVPLSVCNSFGASWIGDFTVPRIGAFVEPCCREFPYAGRAWHEEIPSFLAFHIPLWFAYRNDPSPGREISKITESYRTLYLPNELAAYVLKKATEHAYHTDNDISIADQYAAGIDVPAHMMKDDYYGCYVQRSTPSSRVHVLRRPCGTSAYKVSIIGHTAYVTVVNEYHHPHTHLENQAPELYYRQRRDDTYDTFVAREKDDNRKLEATESASQRERRQAREAVNSGQPVPDKYGPTVFAWIGERPNICRMQVKPEEVPALWERTTPDRRTYNSFRNEYDVDDATFYDVRRAQDVNQDPELANTTDDPTNSTAPVADAPHVEWAIVSSEDDDRRLYTAGKMPKIALKDDTVPVNADGEQSMVELADTLLDKNGMDLINDEGTDVPETDSIRSIVFERFGYRPPSTDWHSTTREGQQWVDENKITKLYRTLGNWDREDNMSNQGLQPKDFRALADYVVDVKNGKAPPKELTDLARGSRRINARPVYDDLRVKPYNTNGPVLGDKEATSVWYMLMTIGSEPIITTNGCRILTDMATNVLHLQRADFGSTADSILRSFLRRGIRVRLLRRVNPDLRLQKPREWTSTLRDKPLGIGIQPNDVELTSQDYKAYMRARDKLLHGPAGRAALLQGGIVWRLARHACTLEETAKGADVENEAAHAHMYLQRLGGETYGEAVLSTQDMYIIVGVYRVFLEPGKTKGQSANTKDSPANDSPAQRKRRPANVSITSWWPTDETWSTSGYGTGYWSHAAEIWFQRRLRMLREGKAKAMSQNEWRKSLRHTLSDSHKFIHGIEKLSASRLSQ
ncbi:hypothetical protein BC629DRAFT_1595493 [Irpex lacteus]|nr:hypothetical protein BC629DRAFT_1595493 [Irpex lacteus]